MTITESIENYKKMIAKYLEEQEEHPEKRLVKIAIRKHLTPHSNDDEVVNRSLERAITICTDALNGNESSINKCINFIKKLTNSFEMQKNRESESFGKLLDMFGPEIEAEENDED